MYFSSPVSEQVTSGLFASSTIPSSTPGLAQSRSWNDLESSGVICARSLASTGPVLPPVVALADGDGVAAPVVAVGLGVVAWTNAPGRALPAVVAAPVAVALGVLVFVAEPVAESVAVP